MIKDLWFVLQMGDKIVKTNDLYNEHDKFIEWTNNMNLSFKNIELPSEKQINYIKYLANKKRVKLIDISSLIEPPHLNCLRQRLKMGIPVR